MEYDQEKVDQLALALLYLNTFEDGYTIRTWKTLAWEVMERLHEKGFIDDPKGKAKSVALTETGLETAAAMFEKHCK